MILHHFIPEGDRVGNSVIHVLVTREAEHVFYSGTSAAARRKMGTRGARFYDSAIDRVSTTATGQYLSFSLRDLGKQHVSYGWRQYPICVIRF